RKDHFHFFGEAFFPSAVELFEQSLQEQLILRYGAEVPASPQQQRLLQSTLESIVPLLYISVLVRAPGLDLPPFHSVMPHQRLVVPLKIGQLRKVVNRRRHPVRTMPRRRAAQ